MTADTTATGPTKFIPRRADRATMTLERGRRDFLRAMGLGGATLAGSVLAGCAARPPTLSVEDRAPASVDELASTTFRTDLRRRGYRPDVSVPTAVEAAWTLPGVNVGTHTAAKAGAVRAPDGSYLIPGDDGVVRSVSLDGDVRWRASTAASARGIHGTPTVANGTVYIGAYDGALYAFEAATGDRQWRSRLGGSIGASPGYHDGVVSIAVEFPDPSGAVFGVDAFSGEVVWRDDRPTDHPHSTHAIDRERGRFVVGSNDGTLYGWSYPDLDRLWQFDTGRPIKGPIATHDGGAAFGSWDGSIYRVSVDDGTEEWAVETPDLVMGGPAIDTDRGRVYCGAHDSNLYAIDFDTGEVTWRYDTGARIIGSATATRDHVLVGSNDGFLHAVRADGSREWRYELGGNVSADPLVDEDGVVVAARATDGQSGPAVRLVDAEQR